jgi:hypothetical protein
MTLVVASRKRSVIAAVSDTGIVEHGRRLPPEQRLPKICILDRNLAVGFAGSPELAVRYLREFPQGDQRTFRSTVDYFVARHRESEGSVDFLLLFNRPTPKIIRIRDGGVSDSMRTAWIGDHDGFERFQRYRARQGLAAVASRYEAAQLTTSKVSESHRDNDTFEMLGALRYLLIDPAVPSVFGEGVAVNNVDGAFEYRHYAIVLVARRTGILVPPAFARRVIAPEIEELRDYAASCLVTAPAAPIQGVAYHYLRGKVTYVYSGERGKPLDDALVFPDMNVQAFMDATKAEFGEWHGSIVTATQPPPDYGISPTSWKMSRRTPGPYRRPGGES